MSCHLADKCITNGYKILKKISCCDIQNFLFIPMTVWLQATICSINILLLRDQCVGEIRQVGGSLKNTFGVLCWISEFYSSQGRALWCFTDILKHWTVINTQHVSTVNRILTVSLCYIHYATLLIIINKLQRDACQIDNIENRAQMCLAF